MRFLLAAMLGLCVGACDEQKSSGPSYAGHFDIVRADGLVVAIEAPAEQLEPGRTYEFRVTVHNKGNKPVTITARSASPVHLMVYRREAAGWEEFLRYPRAELTVLSEWTLRPGQARRFPMHIRIGPDWPVNEPLRVAGAINGLDDLEAAVQVIVRRTEGGGG